MAENSAAEAAPAKKGKLKLIILFTIVVILAIALSIAGTLWFLGGGLPGMGDDSEAEGEVAEETFTPSAYLEIEKALVTTVQGEGRQRYAQAYVAFGAKDPQALAAAKLHLPLIRSQLVMVLGNSSFTKLQTPEGRQGLADNMLTTVNQVLEQEGEPAVNRVLFRNFVVQ
ncbi:MAG: flagellar basal body-associated FliL family protein [Marinobacter sp.]